MSKAILIPIKPIWCAKIMNGDKTVEVRKSEALYKATMKLIEEQGYATFFMYCTKDSKYCLVRNNIKRTYHLDTCYWDGYESNLNGKVVAKFTVRKIEEITKRCICGEWECYGTKTDFIELSKKSCLTQKELMKYLGSKIVGFAYHIEDLVIFDKPKELSEFKHCTEKTCIYGKCHKYMHCLKPLTKAPQNFVFVESEE